ncbi:MAG: flippase-like domain-containing protein [Verrucomicrobia bacterium]|nr:flippase-like domain-containing protein [Verrucomicrobiota bacterium]
MSRPRKIWRVGWRLGVGVVLLGWIFHAIFVNEGRLALRRQGLDWDRLGRAQQWSAAWSHGPRELWATLNLVGPMAFAVSVVWMGATVALGVIRWRMVLAVQGLNLPLSRATEISLVAQFFNSFLLGSSGGDLMKAYYAARETHHKKAEAVVTVLVDRLLGLFAMLLFAGVMMGFNRSLLAQQARLGALAAVILAMLAGCALVVGLAFWGGLSRCWPGARQRLRRLPKGELLERALESCRQFGRRPGFLLKVLGISMVLNGACVLQILTLARGLGLGMSGWALLLIVPAIICIAALPITPSGLGVRENLYVLLLAAPPIGVEPTKALSLSLLAYAGSLLWSLVGGVVYLTFKETHHLAEVSRPETVAEELEGP